MFYTRTSTADDVIATLRQYLSGLQAAPCWMSVWPLVERMLERESEMRPVWDNIARQALTWQQCHSLLEQIVMAGRFSRSDVISRMKDDYRQLEELGPAIREAAKGLAEMLLLREEILNRNAFILDRTTHIVDFIAMAGEDHYPYRSCVHEKLEALTFQFKSDYWPGIPAVLQAIAGESPEIDFRSESDRSIIHGRGKQVPDYLRELFSSIENVREDCWGLPEGFTLTDSSLATLATVMLNTPEPVTADAIKVRRNEFSKKGVRGAWPFRNLRKHGT